jgi:uncharacterized protein
MPSFSLLIKPASADCNLRCEYCFYLKKSQLYPEDRMHRMSDEVLERVVSTYMATEQSVHSFGWQGGEPTLMGVEFFRKVTALQERYGRSGTVVANGLQTNGLLIDDELAAHMGKYRFLVGCSLDGPAGIHDRYRRDLGGSASHERVLRGIECMRRHGVEFNILVLVSRSNVDSAREVYRYLVDNGFLYHQYIPCVEFDDKGKLLPFAIRSREWGEFLCELFDEWYPGDTRRVSIRHFDAVLQKMVDGRAVVCTMGDTCCHYFVVEYNGDIYPCDFFVEPQLRLGNIMDTTWEALWESEGFRRFGALKAGWDARCASCESLNLCMGDCLKHRWFGAHRPDSISWLCDGWRRFYSHTRDRFERLAQQIRLERGRTAPVTTAGAPPVGRNDPCPCGSGKKYKRCCGSGS